MDSRAQRSKGPVPSHRKVKTREEPPRKRREHPGAKVWRDTSWLYVLDHQELAHAKGTAMLTNKKSPSTPPPPRPPLHSLPALPPSPPPPSTIPTRRLHVPFSGQVIDGFKQNRTRKLTEQTHSRHSRQNVLQKKIDANRRAV